LPGHHAGRARQRGEGLPEALLRNYAHCRSGRFSRRCSGPGADNRRPLRISGEIRMKQPCSPCAHELRPSGLRAQGP
jgi:hypothetical protein